MKIILQKYFIPSRIDYILVYLQIEDCFAWQNFILDFENYHLPN